MTNKYLEKIAEMSVQDKKDIARGYDTYLGRTFVHGTVGSLAGGAIGAAAGAVKGGRAGAEAGARIGGNVGGLTGLGTGVAQAHSHNKKLDRMLYGKDEEKKEALKQSMRARGELSTVGRTLGSLNFLGLGGIESHMYNKKLRNLDREAK